MFAETVQQAIPLVFLSPVSFAYMNSGAYELSGKAMAVNVVCKLSNTGVHDSE